MSVLNKAISYYSSITDTKNGIEVNLLKVLQSNKHKSIIEQLRNEPDAAKQKAIKESLPCFTVSGVFNRRNAEGLILSSGLAAIDLDSAEGFDVIHLLNELKKLPYIAYSGLSCRGKRLFCIIPFASDNYTKHYARLIKSFEDLGLPMGDSCHKQISQPRYVSYNDENTQWFNHNAKPYHLLPQIKSYHRVKKNYSGAGKGRLPDNPFKWCIEQINKSHSFIEGARHDYIIQLVRYCNIKGLSESETLNGCLGFIQTDFLESEIKNIVKGIYKAHIGSHAKLPFK